VHKIIAERDRLFEELKTLKFLSPSPSRANFILCSVLNGNAKIIRDTLQKQGILVRYYDTPLLKNYIRISAGKPEHTDKVMQALRDIEEKDDE
jgi:histidinol-phosphate aminotransferase